MERQFFRLGIDVYVVGRWYLGEPTSLAGQELEDVWEFSYGQPVDVRERLRVPIDRPGKPLDFDTAGVGQAPIVNARVASVFREMAPNDVQLFPVEIQGQADPYFSVRAFMYARARVLSCMRPQPGWQGEVSCRAASGVGGVRVSCRATLLPISLGYSCPVHRVSGLTR
jgi:hypothetical protein